MSNYTKLTDYASKDALASGNPSKLIKGTEIDADFLSIQTNMATKIDATTAASPAVVTSLADADQLRTWNNSASAERQVTVANAALYFGVRPNISAVTALSGTSQTITGLPSTARIIKVWFSGFGYTTAGTTNLRIRVGDSGGVLTSGYVFGDGRTDTAGAAGGITSTTGIDIYQGAISRTKYGVVTLTLIDTTNRIWTIESLAYDSAGTHIHHGAGIVTLPTGQIDRLYFSTTAGTNTITGNVGYVYF